MDHWMWKYEDPEDNVIPLAKSDGRIVGVNHGKSVNLKLGGKILSSSQGTDLAVHPDYRKMGLFRKMSDYKTELYRENKVNLTWAVTGNPVVFKTTMEWGRSTFPYPISTFIRIKNAGYHLGKKKASYKLIKKFGISFMKIANRILYGTINYKKESVSNDIYSIENFDDRFNDFWSKIGDDYDFIIVRDNSYLNWRYMDVRGGKSLVYVYEEKGEIIGFVVLKINRHDPDYPEGYIADIIALPERSDVAERLLAKSVKFFNGNNINAVYCLNIKGHPFEKLLRRAGFVDSRNRLYFIIELFDVGDEWKVFLSASAHRLHFQYGDTDWI